MTEEEKAEEIDADVGVGLTLDEAIVVVIFVSSKRVFFVGELSTSDK